jgi:hypothetical protein
MAYADLYDASNVKIGNALGYIADWATVPVALPANTVTLWTLWTVPAGWTKLGATEESFTVNVETNLQQHYIEEQAAPVLTGLTTKDISITAALAEDTMASLALFFGGTNGTVAGPPAVTTLTPDDNLKYYSFGLEMENKQGLARRYYFPKCIITPGGSASFRRAASKRLYPITITPQGKPSDNKVVDITALA